MDPGSTDQMPRHPFLDQPLLYVNGLPEYVRDQDIAQALEACVPFRPQVVRDGSGYSHGSILFKSLERAEKALATVNGKPIPGVQPPTALNLEPFPPHLSPRSRPNPTARPRIVSNLPPNFTDSRLFDIFRGYGPISSARLQPNLGPDIAVIEFWREDDARRAEETMHCSEVDDCSITVHVYQPPRKAEFSVSAPPFIPSGMYSRLGPGSPPLPQSPLLYSPSPPRTNLPYPRSPSMHGGSPLPSYSSPFMHGPGQQVQFAPPSGPGSTSASGLIDPCNLFCKNLDLDIDSNALFAHFRRFGQIVSARVMRNEHGMSRGFGFVSYQTPDQATRAMQAMNGATLGTKQIVVRLHEPKQLRKEKLEKRFGGHNGHPRSHSGATSPTLSEGGMSSSGWPPHDARPRRSSGSYFHAALNGSLNLPMRYEDLSALSPVVRSEVLNGELLRRVRETDGVEDDEIDDIVRLMMELSLDQIVCSLQDRNTFLGQIENARQARQPQPLSAPVLDALNEPIALPPTTSRAASTSSALLDPHTLAATASAPEHPSTPVSFNPSVATPPRTASPTGSFATAGQGEKERLYNAVTRLEPQNATEITDLLLSLNKKERALCLFNADYLNSKVESAKNILSVLEDDPVPTPPAGKPDPTGASQETPPRRTATQSGSPKTPDLSYSRGPSLAASPAAPVTPNTTSMTIPLTATTTTTAVHTLATLAKLPAAEIIKIAGGNPVATTGLPLPKADPLVTRTTDEFIDSIQGKSVAQQKQAVGDKLFKVIKAFGIKGAPKITILLLDTEDLRALAHLMNSYPAVLKEKVLMQAAATK